MSHKKAAMCNEIINLSLTYHHLLLSINSAAASSLYYLRFFYHKFHFSHYMRIAEKKYQKQHHHHLYNGVLAEVQREARGEKMIDFVHHHHNQCANNRQVRVMKELLALSLFMLRTNVQAINFECSTID